jgi:hypothetical protein
MPRDIVILTPRPFRPEFGPQERSNSAASAARLIAAGIPIEHGHAFRSKAATGSERKRPGVVPGMRSWVRSFWRRQPWCAGR